MVPVRSDEGAGYLPIAATRPAEHSQAPLFQLAIWVLEEDGGIMSTGKISKSSRLFVAYVEEANYDVAHDLHGREFARASIPQPLGNSWPLNNTDSLACGIHESFWRSCFLRRQTLAFKTGANP
jgi:hypothetical protein